MFTLFCYKLQATRQIFTELTFQSYVEYLGSFQHGFIDYTVSTAVRFNINNKHVNNTRQTGEQQLSSTSCVHLWNRTLLSAHGGGMEGEEHLSLSTSLHVLCQRNRAANHSGQSKTFCGHALPVGGVTRTKRKNQVDCFPFTLALGHNDSSVVLPTLLLLFLLLRSVIPLYFLLLS